MRDGAIDKEGYLENVGVLNLKDITKEELANIKGIKNIGVIIVPKALMGKFAAKLTKNIGVIVPYEEGMRLYTGKTIFDAETMRQFTTPIDFIQAGKLTLEDDVTPELISQKIQRFINYGKISVPTAAFGAFMAKCEENMGMIVKE